jgi:hypothetical protein
VVLHESRSRDGAGDDLVSVSPGCLHGGHPPLQKRRDSARADPRFSFVAWVPYVSEDAGGVVFGRAGVEWS